MNSPTKPAILNAAEQQAVAQGYWPLTVGCYSPAEDWIVNNVAADLQKAGTPFLVIETRIAKNSTTYPAKAVWRK